MERIDFYNIFKLFFKNVHKGCILDEAKRPANALPSLEFLLTVCVKNVTIHRISVQETKPI